MSRTAAETVSVGQAAVREAIQTDGRAWDSQSPSRPRHVFDSQARTVLSCTLAVGAVVALAPAIPSAVRSQALFVGLGTWTGAVIWSTASAARLAGRSVRRDFATAATVVAVIGIAVAVLVSTQLEIIRVLYNRPALTWNIDWRFHLHHAQAIARHGGLERALHYAGIPVDYHVGPAWLAAATQRVLGHGLYGESASDSCLYSASSARPSGPSTCSTCTGFHIA